MFVKSFNEKIFKILYFFLFAGMVYAKSRQKLASIDIIDAKTALKNGE